MRLIYTNFTAASFNPLFANNRYGLILNAALVIDDGIIAWVGEAPNLPVEYLDAHKVDLGGRMITPALIDCHTHVIYGGDRAEEFEMRLNGASYEEVARAGGGIISTVKKTREASVDELLEQADARIRHMMGEGVAHIEIKSGYGLDLENELKMLKAAKRVGENYEVGVSKTLLAAHAVPPEYKDDADAYIDLICEEILPQAHAKGLVDAVDAFCEGIAFDAAQISKVFAKAETLGIPVKIHSEQLSNMGGTQMTAKYKALSADHIEYLDQAGVEAMAKANMVAVLLPAAFYTLRETQLPPIDALRKAGVALAIGTDCNPGSSPIFSPLLTMNMACTLFRMTPEEALAGFTINAAKALGLDHKIGSLEVGKIANLAIWNLKHPRCLSYPMGHSPLFSRVYQDIKI